MKFGYALSSEEHAPRDLVEHAAAAEVAGFEFALNSDHFHPWIDRQGQRPFVRSVLGAIQAVQASAFDREVVASVVDETAAALERLAVTQAA